MCGKFYWDATQTTLKKVAESVVNADKAGRLCWGEIRPGDNVAVLVGDGRDVTPVVAEWGFLNDHRQITQTYARTETAAGMRSLGADLRFRRCIIPASGYTDESREEDKRLYFDGRGGQMMMAGLWRRDCDGDYHFVLLTLDTTPDAMGIHRRIPMTLDAAEARDWLFSGPRAYALLGKRQTTLSYVKIPNKVAIR